MNAKLNKIGVLIITSMIVFVMIGGTASARTINFNHNPTESQYYSQNPSIITSADGTLNVSNGDYVKWENILHNRLNNKAVIIIIGGIAENYGVDCTEYSTSLGSLSTFDDKPLGNYSALVVDNSKQFVQAYHVYQDGFNTYSISDSHLMEIQPA